VPLFTSPEARAEAGLSKMFVAQVPEPGEPPTHMWQPVSEIPKYSFWPLIIGTLKVTFVALAFAFPLALGAAIFTSEFAPPWLKEIVKPVIELLAGIPSVVLGFFALLVMATTVQDLFGFDYRLNTINAGIALGLAVIPDRVHRRGRRADRRAPKLPTGLGGPGRHPLANGTPSGVPRRFSRHLRRGHSGLRPRHRETMIVLMASGNQAIPSWHLGYGFRSLSATVASELGEVVSGQPPLPRAFLHRVLLFVFTFFIISRAKIWVGPHSEQKAHGGTMKRRWIDLTSVFFHRLNGPGLPRR
jgi:phosphate transport system permease protein